MIFMHEIDLAKLDLNLLAAFEVLNEERHVGRAAKRLHLSQSATSHALGRLRRLFDDPLFVRNPRGIEPTPRARELGPPIANALADIRRVLGSGPAFAPAELERDFRIAAHDHAMAVLVAPLVGALRTEAPGVNLRCIAIPKDSVVAALDRGDVDVALGGFVGLSAARIARVALFSDRFVGIARAGHPVVRRKPSLRQFLAYPHVMVAAAGEDRGDIDGALAAAGAQRRVAVTTSSFLAVPGIVEASDLLGVLPERLARRICAPATLQVFPLPLAAPPLTCSALVLRPLVARPEMRWLLDRLRASISR